MISRPAIARPRATLVVVGLITALLGAAAAGVRTDNSLPVWLSGDDPELAVYERFRARFGEDSFVLAAAAGVDLSRAEDRAALAAVASDLRAAPGVGQVHAPVGADGALADDLVARRLVGAHMAGLLVTPREDVAQADRPAFVDAVATRLREAPLTFHLAGPEVINRDMDAGSQASFGTLFPVVVAVIAGVLLWALRAPTVVAAVLLTAGIACVWTIGALALAGRSLNMVVVIVPALLVVLGTAYAIHLVTAAGRPTGPPGEAGDGGDLLRAAEHAFAPCLLTALTTAAGLVSLASSGLAPVRDLGLFGALGVLVAFLLTFTALPAALSLLRPGAARPTTPLPPVLPHGDLAARWTAAVARRAPLILAAGALLLGASVVGLRALRVESHVLRFFAADHPLRADTAAIEDGLVGLTPIEAWLEGPADAVLSTDTIAAARGFTADCQAEPDVLQVISPLDHDPRLAKLPPAAAAKLLRRALAGGDLDLSDPTLARYVRREGGALAVRLTLCCRTTESERSLALSLRLRERLDARFARAGVEAHVTGAIPLLVRVQTLLVRTQVASFAGALVVVAAIMLAAYRAPLLVLAALVPNVVPVLLTLGAMGWSGVPLDVATVTVASIALGLVVDDTIHMLHRYVEARGQGAPRQGAVASALRVVARPVLLTWLAMALGFAAFGAAPFRPTRDFGLLVAATSVSAVACDLLLLPALLLVGARAPVSAAPPLVDELAREVTP